jgi:hypothetical protein
MQSIRQIYNCVSFLTIRISSRNKRFGQSLKYSLSANCFGKVHMFVCMVAIRAPKKVMLLDIARAQILLETWTYTSQVLAKSGRTKGRNHQWNGNLGTLYVFAQSRMCCSLSCRVVWKRGGRNPRLQVYVFLITRSSFPPI